MDVIRLIVVAQLHMEMYLLSHLHNPNATNRRNYLLRPHAGRVARTIKFKVPI
jgi:hypothetical protein